MRREAAIPKSMSSLFLRTGSGRSAASSRKRGPIFVDLKVETGEDYPKDFRRLYSIQHRDAFRRALENT